MRVLDCLDCTQINFQTHLQKFLSFSSSPPESQSRGVVCSSSILDAKKNWMFCHKIKATTASISVLCFEATQILAVLISAVYRTGFILTFRGIFFQRNLTLWLCSVWPPMALQPLMGTQGTVTVLASSGHIYITDQFRSQACIWSWCPRCPTYSLIHTAEGSQRAYTGFLVGETPRAFPNVLQEPMDIQYIRPFEL